MNQLAIKLQIQILNYVKGEIDFLETSELERRTLSLFRKTILDEKEIIPIDFRQGTTTASFRMSVIQCPYSYKLYPLVILDSPEHEKIDVRMNYQSGYNFVEIKYNKFTREV